MSDTKQEPGKIIKFNGKVLIVSDKIDADDLLSKCEISMNNIEMNFEGHDMKNVAEEFIDYLENYKNFYFEVEKGKIITVNNARGSHKYITFKIVKSYTSIWDCICGYKFNRGSSYREQNVSLDQYKELLIEEFNKFLL